ncbi:MAG: DEAD/DEAH box helicase [Thermoanaerobaculia bacterium]|nr:DEAD/DEAH box helicase [Thermoanaerobaculia bacterium]
MSQNPLESFEAALDRLRSRLGERLVAERRLAPDPARMGELLPPPPPSLAAALAAQGIERLWSHQVEAISAARAGKNVLVTTATASGKSLVFQLPVLEEALAGGPGRAIFLFPLKALGQDQRGKLLTLAQAAGLDADEFGCEIYDGDTPSAQRAAIRRRPPQVLVTNPDMLHLGILAHPGNWPDLLANLKWIVLDELHVYRGLFGAHFHHVLQRLLRLARAHGAHPAIIASSATAQNAREFAELLAAEPFLEVTGSGAPREARRIFLVRPEASPYTLTLDLLTALVGSGQKTIVFTKARRITELLYGWLQRKDRELSRRVACYRAGFLSEERREIEARLLSGELDAVISTSALELGIDIGGLDACLLVGFPGSMMATWQRSGRVGRRGRESLTALVALPDALDQYLLEHPDELLARPCEPLLFDPENEPVARIHLECAAAEEPLSRVEDARYLERHAAVVGDLLREGTLVETRQGSGLVARRRRPQRDVNLRGTGATFVLVDRTRGATIGTLDGVRVFSEGHPGAVYLHHGRQYEVAELDLDRRRVIVQPTEVDFFTSPLSRKETEILGVLEEREIGGLQAALGRLRITEQVTGFERKRTQGQEVIDQQSLDLPPAVMECVGLWFRTPEEIALELAANGRHLLGSLHAAEHATIGLFPLLALCDRNDLGGISLAFHPQLGGAGVFVYEGHPGGMGIAKKGFRELEVLLAKVRDHVANCACEEGCPSCIQSPKCGNGNRPLDKRGAVELLTMMLDPARPASAHERAPMTIAQPSAVAPAARHSALKRGKAPVKEDALAGLEVSSPPPSPERAGGVPSSTSLYRKNAARVEDVVRAERATRVQGFAGKTVLFDIETLRSATDVGGWNKAHKMGIALAVVCHLEEGRFETFLEPRAGELAATLKSAGLVIGFNSRRFDYAVLSGYTGEDYARTLPTLDLLDSMVERLGRRVSLDHLTKETLGAGKTADGLQSLQWVKEGRFDLIEAYCRRDVELLRDLYLFGRREGHVWIADRSGRVQVPVDW